MTLSDLPPTSGRIFSDTILFDPKELIFPSDSAETRSELRQSIDRLDPFVGNLWGYAYALTPDPDLMMSAEGLRTLKSFLDDPGPERDVAELRLFLSRWLVPMLRPRFL